MTPFEKAVAKLLRNEGGFVDDPADSGGATNWGLTERLAREYGYTGSMRDMTREQALPIYRAWLWEPLNLAAVYAIAPSIAEEIFDTGANCGRERAVKMLQRCLNVLNDNERLYGDVIVDGKLGNRTIEALSHCLAVRGQRGIAVILRGLNALQGHHYITLAEARPKDERFAYGWLLNRVEIECLSH